VDVLSFGDSLGSRSIDKLIEQAGRAQKLGQNRTKHKPQANALILLVSGQALARSEPVMFVCYCRLKDFSRIARRCDKLNSKLF
jgi:hypothetical protein